VRPTDPPVVWPIEAMVAPVLLGVIVAAAREHEVSLSALFRGLEIDDADLDMPDTWIAHRDAITVVRRALALMPIAEMGLALGQRAKVTESGALALGKLSAATLGEAMSLSVRHAASAGHLLQIREVVSCDGHQLLAESFPGEVDLQPFLVDLTFAAMVQVRRQITSARYSPLLVELVRDAPSHADAHEAFFGCTVRFGCLRNALTTPPHWLDFRLPWANVLSSRLSAQLLERQAGRLPSKSAVGCSVERAIRRGLPHVADLGSVAASLNLSERTLRRQLAQVGLTYRQLLDEGRKSLAFELMSRSHRPVAELAAATGFSDPRAFTRAFKRWTGLPPSQVRGPHAPLETLAVERDV
jgi:AraC-like DNA-binding protein